MSEKLHQLFDKKKGERPAGEWFVRNHDLTEWHLTGISEIAIVREGTGEEFYYESWELVSDRAYRIDEDGHRWALLETDEALFEYRDDFDLFGAESPR